MKLSKVLQHLQPTYKSVEIDIACLLHENKWASLVTLVRFSYEDPLEANDKISHDSKLQKLKSGKTFRIYKKYFAINNLPAIVENFQKGIKVIDGNTISYYQPIDLMNYDLSYYRHYPSSDTDFGAYTTFASANNELRSKLYSIAETARSDVVPVGYDDIFDAIRHVFLQEYVAESTSYVTVKLPVFARIDSVESEGEKIQIKCRYHKKLGGLYLRYKMKNFPDIEPEPFDQSRGSFKEEGDFEIWQVEAEGVPFARLRDDIKCDVNLFLEPLSEDVSSFTKPISMMMAEKKLIDANPLAKVFSMFCNIEEFQQMFEKAEVRRSKMDVSDHFERTVSWLFTLHGFRSIWLGKDWETLRSVHNVNLGSADVICYSDAIKTLPIISCKIGEISDETIDKIRNLSKVIEDELRDLGVTVVPVIVSAKAADAVKQKAKEHGVHVIDVNDLKMMLKKLQGGPPRPDLLIKPINEKPAFQNFNVHY